MHVVLLSGGCGKRLWPLSNNVRSKQFLQLFTDAEGRPQSMLQRVCQQLRVNQVDNILITTNQAQVGLIKEQLADVVNICVEPCRRDTFPAVVLACAYLRDVLKVGLDECVVVCPVDPWVDESYFRTLKALEAEVQRGDANLVLMGIEPHSPSEKFGYIIPEDKNQVSQVKQFKEKPPRAVAETYLAQGALWNAGVFAFRLGYVLAAAQQKIPFTTYQDLLQHYDQLPKTSFDYAIVEHEPQIRVVRYQGYWDDIGTWRALTAVMPKAIVGPATLDDNCQQVKIVNELNLPIVALGLKNCVIAVSDAGILVADLDSVDHLKKYVE